MKHGGRACPERNRCAGLSLEEKGIDHEQGRKKPSLPGSVCNVLWISKNLSTTQKATEEVGLKRAPWPKGRGLF